MASIKTVTQRIIKKSNEVTNEAVSEQLIFGTVTQIEPLKVKIDSKFEILGGASLLVSSLCKPPLLEDGLIVGDKVRMLSLNNSQVLYIIEKEV